MTSTVDDVQAGDLVASGGEIHRIARVVRLAGWAWPIAFDDRGWAMALGDAGRPIVRGGGPAEP